MPVTRVMELGSDRFLLDLGFRDTEGLVASYLLPQEDGWTLVETGPGSCQNRLRDGLAQAGVSAAEVRRVFVTHIHLDHAGGLGASARMFPEASLFVHREGLAHMVDPTRLVTSARRAWGPASDRLWGPVAPVPAQKLTPLSGGESFELRRGELRVINTPGHAKHHLAFFDTATDSLFTGDGAGVRLENSWRARPALPPPDLDLVELIDSLDRMRALSPRRLLYSHFGPRGDALRQLNDYGRLVDAWKQVALGAAREQATPEHIAEALRRFEQSEAAAQSVELPTVDRTELISGTDMAAQGLLRYFHGRGLLPG